MFDHIGINVANIGNSRRFYEAALAPLGHSVVYAEGTSVGLGKPDAPSLWITEGKAGGPVHLAFVAPNRQAVAAFHKAALAAGAKDNGGPGLRPNYHPNYYGAFVFDPDGNNIEAVCHTPEKG